MNKLQGNSSRSQNLETDKIGDQNLFYICHGNEHRGRQLRASLSCTSYFSGVGVCGKTRAGNWAAANVDEEPFVMIITLYPVEGFCVGKRRSEIPTTLCRGVLLLSPSRWLCPLLAVSHLHLQELPNAVTTHLVPASHTAPDCGEQQVPDLKQS